MKTQFNCKHCAPHRRTDGPYPRRKRGEWMIEVRKQVNQGPDGNQETKTQSPHMITETKPNRKTNILTIQNPSFFGRGRGMKRNAISTAHIRTPTACQPLPPGACLSSLHPGERVGSSIAHPKKKTSRVHAVPSHTRLSLRAVNRTRGRRKNVA